MLTVLLHNFILTISPGTTGTTHPKALASYQEVEEEGSHCQGGGLGGLGGSC